jgi:hypothetical protein
MTVPSCVRYYLDVASQTTDAVPVIGIYAESLEGALNVYKYNIRQNLFSVLNHCTHIMAEVNGIYVDDFKVRVPKDAIFYTEEVLRLGLEKNESVQNLV